MYVDMEYSTQVRTVTGLSRERIDLADDAVLPDLLKKLLGTHAKLASWIEPSGLPKPGLLLFVNDQSPTDVKLTRLQPNDRVALMTLVSGG